MARETAGDPDAVELLPRFDEADVAAQDNHFDVLALDQALVKLAALDARQARIVELRFFGGLTCEEVATVLELSRRTVQGDWKMARTWLRRELE